jgi:tRNA pseudouridine32 synthase/23S rRNA pseudouridine746 synthase
VLPRPALDETLVYGDDAVLVLEKPEGLLAVPGRGPDKQDCLASRVQRAFPDALVVHRLDMATSGLMVFARGREMQGALSRLFREREVYKRYVAVVAGLPEDSGEIDLPLAVDWPSRPRQKVDVSGKPALTRYRVLEYDAGADIARVELEPVTGRTHQLRVHMAALGHPILGDRLYGPESAARLMLHASALGFAHPVTGRPLGLSSAAPF